MSNNSIWDFVSTASQNTATPPNGFGEGQFPSLVDDTFRALMAELTEALHSVQMTGSSTAFTMAFTNVPASYTTGMRILANAGVTNSGAATLNVNSLGAKNIKVMTGSGLEPLTQNEIQAGGEYSLIYDGTQFQLLNPSTDEGSWTPAFAGTGVAGTFTYSTQVGRYYRWGNKVDAWCRIVTSGVTTSPTVNLTVGGLPFTASTESSFFFAADIGAAGGFTLDSGYTQLGAVLGTDSRTIYIQEIGSGKGQTNFTAANLSTSADLNMHLTFRIN